MSGASTSSRRGFTFVELLASAVLITALLLIVVAMTSRLSDLWRGTAAKIEQFSEARSAFDSLTRRLSQATLNTYWDYDDLDAPTQYVRQSELRFICQFGAQGSHEIFFQAPLGYSDTYRGLSGLLNTWGFYVEYADDRASRPSFVNLPARWRFRLMEYMEPSEKLTVYSKSDAWCPASGAGRAANAHVLAENVIALILLPRLAPQEDATGTRLAPFYAYDSTRDGPNGSDASFNTRNQLPPVVQVTLVAIDEASALRLTSAQVAMLQARLGELFRDAGSFDGDLKKHPGQATDASLEAALIALKVNYHIFTTNVVLRGAKWSRQ